MSEDKLEEESQVTWIAFKSGLSRNSFLAVLYAIVIFIPALIYLTLMTGGVGGIPVAWFTLLLWIELGKLSGRQITKQEAMLILLITGTEMVIPLSYVYNAWYRASPIAALFNIGPYVPDWVAPAPETGVLELRTFFHPAWILPISIGLASTLFGGLFAFGLGLFAREMFIETERLPFPIHQMYATSLVTLTGEKKRPLYILAVFAAVGFGYGFVVYAFPFVMQALQGRTLRLIPIPWADLNTQIEGVFPGACFGIATDLGPIASGFILSLPVVLGIFIGSLAFWFFGNWLVNTNWASWGLPDTNPDLPGIQTWWEYGMNIHLAWQRSLLYFWATILIGVLLAVGIAPILRHPYLLKRAFSSFKSRGLKRHTEPISFTKVTLPMLGVGLAGGIALFVILVPDFVQAFPWIIAFTVTMPFVTTIIGARLIGETGIGSFPVGYIQNMLYYASGYPGVDVWFAPNYMTSTGHGWLGTFKVAELTETRSDSIIKAYWLLLPLALIVGYIYVELFWKIAPIPSGRYPGAVIFWDIQATMQSLWIKGRELPGLFTVDRILYTFIITTALYMVLDFVHSPITLVALGAGVSTITPIAVTMVLGALIAKIFSWRMGKEWWDKHKMLIAAGLLIGEGLAVVLSVSVSLIINSIWVLPY